MRPDPVISGGWIKAALIALVAGALGLGAYVLASGVDIDIPDLNRSTTDTQTNLSRTNLEDTTIAQTTTAPKPPTATQTTPVSHSIQALQELGRCTQAANGDLDKINACFDRFNKQAP